MLFSVIIIAMKAELSCQNFKENYTVATRMDTPKSGWTPYVNYTTVYSSEIAIYGYKFGRFLRKVGKSE